MWPLFSARFNYINFITKNKDIRSIAWLSALIYSYRSKWQYWVFEMTSSCVLVNYIFDCPEWIRRSMYFRIQVEIMMKFKLLTTTRKFKDTIIAIRINAHWIPFTWCNFNEKLWWLLFIFSLSFCFSIRS